MKKKGLLKLAIILLAIVSLIAVPRILKQNKIRNEIKPVVESWAEKKGFAINGYSATVSSTDNYYITLKWNDFDNMSPSHKGAVVKSWDSDFKYDFKHHLEFIIANGHKYRIQSGGVYSYEDGEWIVPKSSSKVSSSGSSSSSSQKTAKCNYCNGTGKVNGEKCPWCNGSGKTYDNAFNDALGGGE